MLESNVSDDARFWELIKSRSLGKPGALWQVTFDFWTKDFFTNKHVRFVINDLIVELSVQQSENSVIAFSVKTMTVHAVAIDSFPLFCKRLSAQ